MDTITVLCVSCDAPMRRLEPAQDGSVGYVCTRCGLLLTVKAELAIEMDKARERPMYPRRFWQHIPEGF